MCPPPSTLSRCLRSSNITLPPKKSKHGHGIRLYCCHVIKQHNNKKGEKKKKKKSKREQKRSARNTRKGENFLTVPLNEGASLQRRGCQRCGGWRRCAAPRCSPLRAARGAALPPLLPVTRAQPRAKRREAQPGPAVPELCETWGRCSPQLGVPRGRGKAAASPDPHGVPSPTPPGGERQPLPLGAPGPPSSPDLPTRGAGRREPRQPPSPFTARAHPSAASRAPPSPAPQGHPSADAASGDRRSPQPTPAPRSRSYLRRPEERRGAERPGARRRPLSPERRHAGSRAARRLPPAPGRCAALGGGAPSDLAGPRRAGKPRGGRAAPLPSLPRCRPRRSAASPAGLGLPSAGRGRRRSRLRRGCRGRAALPPAEEREPPRPKAGERAC